ncbi:MAG TPA: toxin-antitoxin system YwqK family antitoxin [Bacteroidia bacterium]|nr:toxin-antitoxin system YwqK family antitoxin [Bacteroidia bacterium]
MRNTLKICLIALLAFIVLGNKAIGQTQPPDTTAVIILDTLRIVYIYADTSKALNRVDKMGRKQGMWEQKYPNGNIRYKGRFKDDKPTGVFKYYYEANDSLRILAIYSDNGKVSRVHEYYPSGALASTGKYVDQQKDSVWKIYDPIQKLRHKDQYVNGKREGKSIIFFPDGNILESKSWHNGLENGKWQQFFDNGELKLDGNYVNGKVEGVVNFYNADGKLEISGTYRNDVRDGKWTYYDDAGRAKDSMSFKNDRPLDPRKFILTPAQIDSMRSRYSPEDDPDKPQYHQKHTQQEDDYGN